jgi:exosortase
MATTQSVATQPQTDQQMPWYIIGGLCVVVVWAYWNTIGDLFNAWVSPQYSHGFLIPIFTAVLIAMRRQAFEEVSAGERWCGMGLMAGGLALRLFASYHHMGTPDMISIIPVLMGVFVIAGGWSALRWAGPPLAFLVFMLPLPTAAERGLLNPLQHTATTMSTYTLQTVGVDSYNEGNQIKILLGNEPFPLNVEEQCSGLRMATIFLALAVAMTMIIDRPFWQKILIILSAIPIALIANVIRIVITALLFMVLGQESEFAKTFFHDLAGWFMIPIALGFMYLEMQIMDHVFVEEDRATPQATGFDTKSAIRHPLATRIR